MAGIVKILIETIRHGKAIQDAVHDLDDLVKAGDESILSLNSLNVAANVLQQGIAAVDQAYQAVIAPTIEYANQVRQLSLVSGESAENTSRFIQVLDDFKISSDDALTATRALTKEGYAPNIETLAKLSDQYKSLTSAEEKNEFVIKNLGRAGLGWVEVLNKGSDAIREMGDGVSDSLILNQEALDQAREYELAIDDLSDAWEGFTYQVGTKALPVLTTYIDMLTGSITVTQDFAQNISDGQEIIEAFQDATDGLSFSIGDYTFTIGDATTETSDFENTLGEVGPTAEEMEKAIKGVSDALKTTLGSMSAIDDEFEDFTDAEEKRADKLKELEEGKVRAVLEGTGEREELERDLARAKQDLAADIAKIDKDDEDRLRKKNELLVDFARKQEDIQRKLAELGNTNMLEQVKIDDEIAKAKEESQKASEDFAEAEKKRVFDLVQAGLEKDGVNQKEFEFLQNYLVQQGLITKAAGDKAVAERAAAESVIADYERQNAVTDETQTKLDALVNGSPYVATIQIETVGTIPSISTSMSVRTPVSSFYTTAGNIRNRDEGGRGYAGEAYMIGTGAQPEVFVPDQPGTFYPRESMPKGAGGMTNVFNITGVVDRAMVNYLMQEVTRLQAA
jgi:hypothetical protein